MYNATPHDRIFPFSAALWVGVEIKLPTDGKDLSNTKTTMDEWDIMQELLLQNNMNLGQCTMQNQGYEE